MARKKTKAVTIRRSDGAALVGDGTTFSFGIVFDIKGTPVPISTPDINKLKEQGVKFELPNPVVLGSIADLINYIETTFEVNFPDTDSLPDWLKNIIDKVASMVFTVNVLKLELPAQAASEGNGEGNGEGVLYALEIAGAFPGTPLQPLPGFPLGIQGGVFGATNIAPAIQS